MKRRKATLLKSGRSKTTSLFEEVNNIMSTSLFEHKSAIQKYF